MKFYFSPNTLRFYNNITPESKIYGWEKALTEKPKQTFISKPKNNQQTFLPSKETAPWDK